MIISAYSEDEAVEDAAAQMNGAAHVEFALIGDSQLLRRY
jgi:hypothetical protein